MKKKSESNPSEPYFYIAIVLKGTEKQYLIYQCKSLAYLHVTRDDGVKFRTAVPELVLEAEQQRGDAK